VVFLENLTAPLAPPRYANTHPPYVFPLLMLSAFNAKGRGFFQGTFIHALASWISPTWSFIGGNPNFGIQGVTQNGDTCFNMGSTQPRQVCLLLSYPTELLQYFFVLVR
jgi:hypothetical protein